MVLIGLLAIGCSGSEEPLPVTPPPVLQTDPAQIITLGDIDASDPIKKIKRFRPLADYLASHLTEFGIMEGKVVISRNVEEAGGYLVDGTLDIYIDSAFPILAVQEISDSQIIARRWKGGDENYRSTYITLRDSGIDRIEDFKGKVLAFEHRESTSGFVLPAGTLIQQGFTLREVDRPDAPVDRDEIGYYFAQDEENTVVLLMGGLVAGAGFSNLDYKDLSDELQKDIAVFGKTISVPGQLVSIRPGLDPLL